MRIYGLFVFAEVKSFVCLHSDSLEAIQLRTAHYQHF